MKKLVFMLILAFFFPKVVLAYKWCDASVIPDDVRFYIIKFFCLIINTLLNSPLLVKLIFFFGILFIIFYKILSKIGVI